MNLLPPGFPTHSIDINNEVICIGDICDYDFEGDEPCPFEVVFEDNAFRKKYKKWDKAGTVLSNFECMNNEPSVDKKNDPECIRSIEKEIVNADIIISFIDSIVFDQQTKRDSSEFTTNEPN